MNLPFPEDNDEFQSCWTQKAGEHNGLRAALTKIQQRAALRFTQKKDDLANELRSVADEIQALEQEASKDLQGFIEEDRRRNKRSKK